jgi:hypothetical protein
LLLYTNHHPWSESFPYGPSQSLVTLPPWHDAALSLPRVYSFALDRDAQLRKLFALDAMHDLRAPPLRLNGGPAGVLLERFWQAIDLIRRDPFGDYSYYRRAVRPNELFFVYGPPDRRALEHNLAGTLPRERRQGAPL